MKRENVNRMNFFSEMSEYQITAREFFSTVLLDSLKRNFGYENILISYFDTHGNFLSWTDASGSLMNCEEHPYRKFVEQDAVRNRIFMEAVRDHLTYFNVEPRLYKATDVIGRENYEYSPYANFLEENFRKHYSVTMAFGINGYIQAAFMKSKEEGDFAEAEMEKLENIYVYLANSYKNFKKYEQAKIVANIQSEIIASGEKAFLVTDDFAHVMSYNKIAQNYLTDILGESVEGQIDSSAQCSWLPFLLGGETEECGENLVRTRLIKNYIFKIYTYDQTYSNGIVDRYHWITISLRNREDECVDKYVADSKDKLLTNAEQRVAELMCKGLTYKAIADELVVSYHTVKKHVQNIYSKCNINSRYELYKWMEHREQR
ncbi:MAG: response regulator transcription factor [Lachnospiraceae bacterium]